MLEKVHPEFPLKKIQPEMPLRKVGQSKLDDFKHFKLDAEARKIDMRYTRWIGIKSGSSKRRYICRLCGMQIDSESAKYPMTKHAYQAIHDHQLVHLQGYQAPR